MHTSRLIAIDAVEDTEAVESRLIDQFSTNRDEIPRLGSRALRCPFPVARSRRYRSFTADWLTRRARLEGHLRKQHQVSVSIPARDSVDSKRPGTRMMILTKGRNRSMEHWLLSRIIVIRGPSWSGQGSRQLIPLNGCLELPSAANVSPQSRLPDFGPSDWPVTCCLESMGHGEKGDSADAGSIGDKLVVPK